MSDEHKSQSGIDAFLRGDHSGEKGEVHAGRSGEAVNDPSVTEQSQTLGANPNGATASSTQPQVGDPGIDPGGGEGNADDVYI